MATATAPCVCNRRSAQDVGTPIVEVLVVPTSRSTKCPEPSMMTISSPLASRRTSCRRRDRIRPPSAPKVWRRWFWKGHRSFAEVLTRYTAEFGVRNLLLGTDSLSWVCKWRRWLWRGQPRVAQASAIWCSDSPHRAGPRSIDIRFGFILRSSNILHRVALAYIRVGDGTHQTPK